MIAVRDLDFRRADGFALRMPDFRVAAGERVALTGPSGCGKSTALALLAGLLAAQGGGVVVAGVDLATLGGPARRALRRGRIGYVAQDSPLLGWLSALENVLLPARLAGTAPAAAADRARELAGRLGVASLLSRRADRLSAGERQRVALCRALLPRPRVLLLDEPTAALDAAGGAAVGALLAEAAADGAAVVAATHDGALAASCARVEDAGRWRRS